MNQQTNIKKQKKVSNYIWKSHGQNVVFCPEECQPVFGKTKSAFTLCCIGQQHNDVAQFCVDPCGPPRSRDRHLSFSKNQSPGCMSITKSFKVFGHVSTRSELNSQKQFSAHALNFIHINHNFNLASKHYFVCTSHYVSQQTGLKIGSSSFGTVFHFVLIHIFVSACRNDKILMWATQ